MSRLGVPIVDAARIVEGQGWASKIDDGRHFHKIVPIEVRLCAALAACERFDFSAPPVRCVFAVL